MTPIGNALRFPPHLSALDIVRVTSACVIAAWILFGLFGRDPWKPDEAYTFGLVNHIVQTGDWVVPSLAGEPFMEKPPLFYMSAAVFVNMFEDVLTPHDAARLATAFYVALTLVFAALTSRKLYGEGRALACVLTLIGCLGYLHSAHLLITDNALVAGIAIATYGFAIILDRPILGGLAVGTGAGVAFLSKGLLGPGLIGLTALALMAFPSWQTRRYVRSLGWAALAFAPWALVWPLLLYQRSPQLFNEWLFVNNLGRYTGTAQLGPELDHFMYLKILPWFAFPALPLAAWHAWNAVKAGGQPWCQAQIQLPLVSAGVMLVVLSLSASARNLYAMPLLVPLCLLAAAKPVHLPQRLAILVYGVAACTGAVLAVALWGSWIAFVMQWPAEIADWFQISNPGFVPSVDPLMTIIALAATAAWILIVHSAKHSSDAIALTWAASVTVAWGLLMTLWLPYQDFRNSYRSMILDMRDHIPASSSCIANRDLGEPQRAMLEYFGGITTYRESSVAGKACELLIVQGAWLADEPAEAHWAPLWTGSRPGDSTERFWLLRRVGP